VKATIALAVASAIILGVALWFIWPGAPNDTDRQIIAFAHKSPPPAPTIDPPFGFHWGDSMAHVEALLGYSSAAIVSRIATQQSDVWIVEGLIQPGLKSARFNFEKNALTGVDLHCQYDAWPSENYRRRAGELGQFFDRMFGANHRLRPKGGADPDEQDPAVYSWQLGDTSLAVICRSDAALTGKRLSVNSLAIRYRDSSTPAVVNDPSLTDQARSDTVVQPNIAEKLAGTNSEPPNGSNFGITSARLMPDPSRGAYVLQLEVKLRENTAIDPIQAVVAVNFYDTLATGEIVLTDANVTYDWQSLRDWKQVNPEKLAVTYLRSAGNSQLKDSGRKFFGYVVTVSYAGRLETVHANPIALLNLFPVRTFISPFESAHAAAARQDYAAAANLYRRAADQGNLFALENLAWFYAKGKGVEKDEHQAAMFYERAALQNTPRSLNALAWFLATCPNDGIRNGAEAVRHAAKACELSYWQQWKYIDTLAAAWAENGDFKRAVEFEQQAAALKNIDDDQRKKSEERLALYLKRQPVRE
jgi:hypothetical protein